VNNDASSTNDDDLSKKSLQSSQTAKFQPSIDTNKAEKITVKPYAKLHNVDLRKVNKKQLSPVLLNRNSSNNLSNIVSKVRDSGEYIKDSK